MPKKSVSRRITGFVGVRITTAEKAAMVSAAARRKVSISQLVRDAVVRAMHDAPPSNTVAG